MGTVIALVGCLFCGWVWAKCDWAETALLNAGIRVRLDLPASLPVSYGQGMAKLRMVKWACLAALCIFGLAAGVEMARFLLGV